MEELKPWDYLQPARDAAISESITMKTALSAVTALNCKRQKSRWTEKQKRLKLPVKLKNVQKKKQKNVQEPKPKQKQGLRQKQRQELKLRQQLRQRQQQKLKQEPKLKQELRQQPRQKQEKKQKLPLRQKAAETFLLSSNINRMPPQEEPILMKELSECLIFPIFLLRKTEAETFLR